MIALAALATRAFLSANALLACPMCFGDPNSSMVKGAKVGAVSLLLVVVGLLIAIASVARSWVKRGRALDAAALATTPQAEV